MDDFGYETKPKFHEENGLTVKYLSTSPLEGENGRLNSIIKRKLAGDVLERIIQIHALNVNIRQGVNYGRIQSSVQNINAIELLVTTLQSRNMLAVTKEIEWITEMLTNNRKSVVYLEEVCHSETICFEFSFHVKPSQKKNLQFGSHRHFLIRFLKWKNTPESLAKNFLSL